jgi:hypothetical protein
VIVSFTISSLKPSRKNNKIQAYGSRSSHFLNQYPF